MKMIGSLIVFHFHLLYILYLLADFCCVVCLLLVYLQGCRAPATYLYFKRHYILATMLTHLIMLRPETVTDRRRDASLEHFDSINIE